jgi:hypothetical protein
MKRTIKTTPPPVDYERRERNYGEWTIAIAVAYILIASTWWLAGFVNQTRFRTAPLTGGTMLQQ